MIIKSAEFAKSSASPDQCPDANRPEYAFIGRSNVGKSSIINMLTGRQKLAKISSQPGKTQLINHFDINEAWFLVDLPGYGYAKVARTKRSNWHKSTMQYLETRSNLVCVFVLIDSRISPQSIDLEFMTKLALKQIPFAMIFTKTDKISKAKLKFQLGEYETAMLKNWESLPEHFISSAKTGRGRDPILNYIDELNEQFQISR